MNAKSKKKSKKPEKGLFDKARDLFSAADDAVDDGVKKVKKSKAFKDASGTLKKIEGYAEGKLGEFKKSGTKKKIDKALVKAEKKAAKTLKKAEKALKKAKKLGSKLAIKAEDRFANMTSTTRTRAKAPARKPKAITASKPKAPVGRPRVVKPAAKVTKPIVAEAKSKIKAVKAPAKIAKPAKPAKPVKPAKPAKPAKPVKAVKAAPPVAKPAPKAVKPAAKPVKAAPAKTAKPKLVKAVPKKGGTTKAAAKPKVEKNPPPVAEPPAEQAK